MLRRTYIIGTVALGLMLTAVRVSPAYCRLLLSARSFQTYFHDLKEEDQSLNPLQRFVFSLMLADGKAQAPNVRNHS
jgi:hypothetical protein